MKQHKLYENMLLLYFYDELNSVDRDIFDRHLATCSRCRNELAGLNAIKTALRQAPETVPTRALVDRLNRQVMDKIQKSGHTKISKNILKWANEIQESLAGGLAHSRYQLVAIGITFILGVFVGKLWLSSGLRNDPDMLANFVSYQTSLTEAEKESVKKALAKYLLQSGSVEVADLIQEAPTKNEDGIIAVNIKVAKDLSLRGGLDDPTIQNMLRYSALHDRDKSRRLHAVKLLSKTPQNSENESTMIAVLLKDSEEELRTKAMEVLRTYKINNQILDTYKTIALHDTSQTIRMIALEELYNNADENVIPIMALIVANDNNDDLRNIAKKYLDALCKAQSQINNKQAE
ncbi:MAG: zf-HC2 domain-containing protein [Candidatus Marinimicrobia bacterium]|nr:zf-HC2 domain-containing protein [Candidatus Neomarinimicrobiota bacterium]